MAVDKNTPRERVTSAGDDTPDWTTWLRSRLERAVASPDRQATEATATEGAASSANTDRHTAAKEPAPPSGDRLAGSGGGEAVTALEAKVESLAQTLSACRELIEHQGEVTERLASWVQELATVQADDERWAVAVGRVVDAADEERRQADQRGLSALAARVEGIEEGLVHLTAELAGLRHALRPAATVKLAAPQLHAVAADIAAAMEARATAPPAGPERPQAQGRRRSTPVRPTPTASVRRTGRGV